MTIPALQSSRSTIAATQSLWSISVTLALAAITHAYEFGAPAFVVGAIIIAILYALNGHYLRTGSRPSLVFYGLLSLWIVVAFGLVGGLWNHAVKVGLSAANGGALPSSLERLFMSPDLGSATYETIGILTFVASMFGVFFGYRFARTVHWTARAGSTGPVSVRPTPHADA